LLRKLRLGKPVRSEGCRAEACKAQAGEFRSEYAPPHPKRKTRRNCCRRVPIFTRWSGAENAL
jgi:hypothetical protein